MRSMLIVNPTSGPWDVRRELPAVLAHLDDHGWQAAGNQRPRRVTNLRASDAGALRGVWRFFCDETA